MEDEAPLQRTVSMAFQMFGINTLLAKNGKEGLATALSERPDLIILDIIMPVMDGFAMLKALRAEEVGKNIPVIYFSNLMRHEVEAKTHDLNVIDCYSKTGNSLLELVTRAKEILQIA